MTAIETQALTKRFRRLGSYRDLVLYPWRKSSRIAVDNLSLQVQRGELFGLLGENGAGKTTLIRMLSTTLLPTSGTATVEGHDVVREPQAVRRLIGLVTGDERSFYWRLTGRQNLEFFAALHHIARADARRRIDELVEIIGLGDVVTQPFQTYSTGTRHKFDIARALITEPKVLFLDEPTRSLDPLAAVGVRDLITRYLVGELGRTVLLATHTLAEAEAICDRLALIRDGRLVAVGTIADLRSQMNLSTTVELRVRGPAGELQRELERLVGVIGATTVFEDGTTRLTVRLDRDNDALNRLLHTALAAGIEIESCTTREPALDEIYRRALGDEMPDAIPGASEAI